MSTGCGFGGTERLKTGTKKGVRGKAPAHASVTASDGRCYQFKRHTSCTVRPEVAEVTR
jgi:hypothetical protein